MEDQVYSLDKEVKLLKEQNQMLNDKMSEILALLKQPVQPPVKPVSTVPKTVSIAEEIIDESPISTPMNRRQTGTTIDVDTPGFNSSFFHQSSNFVPNKLPTFHCGGNYDHQNVDEFILAFSKTCQLHSIQLSRYPDLFIGSLNNPTYSWLQRFNSEYYSIHSSKPNWDSVKEAFIKHFRGHTDAMNYENCLRNLSMKTTIQSYLDEFLDLIGKVGWLSTSASALWQFKNGLPEHLRKEATIVEQQHALLGNLSGQFSNSKPISVQILAEGILISQANYLESYNPKFKSFKDKPTLSDKPDKSKLTCSRCGKIGHFAKECLANKPSNYVKKDTPFQKPSTVTDSFRGSTHTTTTATTAAVNVPAPASSITCHICKNKGHYANTCPKRDPNYYKKSNPNVKRIAVGSTTPITTSTLNSSLLTSVDYTDVNSIPITSDDFTVKKPFTVDSTGISSNIVSSTIGISSNIINSTVSELKPLPGNFVPDIQPFTSSKRNTYGIHTPCLVNGHEVIAFVDGGAQTSFISLSFVKQHSLNIVQVDGKLIQAITGSTVERIGIVQNIVIENGKHRITTELEIADLADDETLIIGLNLFSKLSYSIQGVPIFWPHSNHVDLPKVESNVESTQLPDTVDKNGIAEEWKKVLEDNQNIPPTSMCQLPGSTLSINTIGEPVFTRQYPIPQAYHEAVNLVVQKWLDTGIVTSAPADCQWNSPLLAVRKPGKDGQPDGIRVCFDARELNKLIVNKVDNHLPGIREVWDKLAFFIWLSLLDQADSYHQFGVSEKDQIKTAFTWGKFGQLMFTRVPFGLNIMTGHMQAIMEKLLLPLGVAPFQDDNAIGSKSYKEHVQDVLKVLEALTYKAQLRLNLKKCKFFVKEARVLGCIISREGIRMDPIKVKALFEWPMPVDGKAMQRFLGAANFHRGFSHKYAEISAPLEELRNVDKIVWTEERIQAFNDLRNLFASNILLRPVDWNKIMYLTTDASLIGLGAWIGQFDIDNILQPVVCISKKLTATQQRWSVTKRELYAMMWAMTKLRHYLLGRHFIIQVDHKPLVSMFKDKIGILMEGWIDKILEFDFTVNYIPGEENTLADALSRIHEESNIHIKSLSTSISTSNNLNSELELEAQRRGKIIPSIEERKSIVEEQHLLGHFSVDTTTKHIWREGFWWPGIRSDISSVITSCIDCQRFDHKKEGYHPLQSIEANQPWDHIQIDLIGQLPTSTDGFNYILTVIDVMTGFTILRCLKTKTENETATTLWTLMCDFGIPKILQSDNGTEFVNKVISELVQLYGINQRLITPYHPRANGLVERKNKEVSRLLKKEMVSSTDRWQQLIPFVQLSLNHKELQRTGSKPFELFFGRPFNHFADYQQTTTNVSIDQLILERMEHLEHLKALIYPSIVERTSVTRQKRNEDFNKSSKILEPLTSGTRVMVIDSTRQSKWDPVYEGPFTVARTTHGGSYILLDGNGLELKQRFVISQLKFIDAPSGKGVDELNNKLDNTSIDKPTTTISPEQTSSSSNNYEILGILEHRTNKDNKSYDYLIRWKGYGPQDDSWVNEKNFNGLATIKRYWAQHKKGNIQLPLNRKAAVKKKRRD